jgi:glycosyltransferase involved in cell wall biosynthesis
MNVGGVGDLTGFSRDGASSPPERGFRIGPVGAIVQPQDPAGFARAMAHLLDDPDALIRMGREGRGRVRRPYSIDRLVEDLESLYLKNR